MLNYVVKISVMSATYFEYYTIILRGVRFFVDTLYIQGPASISTITSDPRPVFEARLLFEEIR